MGADRYLWLYAAVVAIAVSLLIYGAIRARSKVLSSNPCRMTYSNPAMTKMPLCGEGCGHQLWKVSNPDSNKLNRQPVLYIPGSLGSYKQARSLASHMHNENAYFQYFAMDFEGGSSSLSAVHGSEVTSQAYSTNRALHKIRKLYKKSNNESLHIILVGHSIGGVVARGSLLLPNHPHCVVKVILQLSSPNQRPPYALDATLDSVYQAINSGWDAANLNRTKNRPISECGNWTEQQALPSDPRAYLLSTDFHCPRCASSVRVVSISGGAIDWQVRPELSSLQGLLPRTEQALRFQRRAVVAHYRSLTAAAAKGGNYSLLGSAYHATRAVLHCALGPVQCGLRLVGLGGGNSSVNSTDMSSISSIAVSSATVGGDNATAAVAGPYPITPMDPALDRRFSFGRVHSNRFLSARTSQLQGVGFPVDHAAIVWCFELLQVLSRSMQTLSSLPSDADINWDEVFPLKYHIEGSPLNDTSFIPDAAVDGDEEEDRDIFALRQEWVAAAKVEEQLMFGSGLQWQWLAKASSDFIGGHLLAVAACVLIVSSLIVVAPYLQVLTGNTPRTGSSHWEMLLPAHHLQVRLLSTALFQLGQAILPRTLLPELFNLSAYAALFAVLCKAGWDLLFFPHEAVLQTAMSYCYWLLAYCLAIAINAALIAFILACRVGFGYAVHATRIALRYTVWNRFVRRSYRLFVKWLRQAVPLIDALARTGARHAVLIALLVTWSTVWGLSSPIVIDRIRVRIHQLLSSLIITSYVAMSVALLQALLHSPYHESAPPVDLHQHYMAMTVLYLPAPVLAAPNLLYACRSLYSHPNNPLHSVAVINSYCLDWDRGISFLVLCLIAMHLRLLRVERVQRLNLSEKPLGLLYEIVGPPAVQQYGEVFAVHVDEDRAAADQRGVKEGIITAACLHEDGGRWAEYEKIDAAALVEGVEHDEVAVGVVLGSTYRVVHCNCASDFSLKDQSEWCSWCTCRRCGGKHLPSQDSDRSHRFYSAYELNDISSALIPVLTVVITAWLLLSWDILQYKPYYYLHTLGILALSYIVRYYMLL